MYYLVVVEYNIRPGPYDHIMSLPFRRRRNEWLLDKYTYMLADKG